MNESTEPDLFAHHQFAGKIVVMVRITPFLPCVIVSNALLVLAVYRQYSLRTPTNAIIVSLAISNLLDAPCLDSTAYCVQPSLNWMPRAKRIYVTILYPWMHFQVFRWVIIVALTADRFIAVTKPLRFASLVTFRRIAIVLGCLWILSILSNTARSVSVAHGSHTSQDQKETDCRAPL